MEGDGYMREIILETHNLTKKYKNFTALDNLNITIQKGDIYGLIGRNGAGKTTLMKLITTLAKPTSGSFTLFGKSSDSNDLYESKGRVGALIEYPAFYPNLSAFDNLKYYAIQRGITDMKQIDKVLDIVNLRDTGKKKVKTFSLGMKQRLGIALAILNNPDFVILDEPINGLDPIGISELRDTFKNLAKNGITLLVSSHILSELYVLSTKFAFIEGGRLIKEITKEELDMECSKCLVIKSNDSKKVSYLLEKELGTDNYKVIDDEEVRVYDFLEEPEKVSDILADNKVRIKGFYEYGISLEDYFKEIIKEGK